MDLFDCVHALAFFVSLNTFDQYNKKQKEKTTANGKTKEATSKRADPLTNPQPILQRNPVHLSPILNGQRSGSPSIPPAVSSNSVITVKESKGSGGAAASSAGEDSEAEERLKANRILETLSLFRSIINNKVFADTLVILFLNKSDLFKVRLSRRKVDSVVVGRVNRENTWLSYLSIIG